MIRAVSANNKLILLSLCWKQIFSTVATVSRLRLKVFAKKNLAQECPNDRRAKQDRTLRKTEQQIVINFSEALL